MKKLIVFTIPIPILILSLISLRSFARPALSQTFRPFWAESLVNYESFHSIGNYNSSANVESLPSANSFFEASNFEYAGRYVFNNNWAFQSGLNYVRVQGNLGNNSKFAGGLQTLKGAIEYKLGLEQVEMVLAAEGQASLLSVSQNSTTPIYGDGAHAIGGSLWVGKHFGAFHGHGKLGYLYRTEGLSSLLPYQIGLDWRLDQLTLSTAAEGFLSLGPDAESDSYRQTLLNRTNVGSLYFRSANPVSNFVDVQAKWNATNQFGLFGGVGTTIRGRNSSEGSRYFVGFELQWQVFQQPMESSPYRNLVPKTVPKPTVHEDKAPLFKSEDFHRQLKEKK